MQASPLLPSFLDIYRDVRTYASSLVFLQSGPFVEVLVVFSSTLRMNQSSLRRGQPRYLSL